MKVATWNIPYSFGTSSHEEAWRYLLSEIPADYYLLQEVQPPEWVSDEYEMVWTDIGGTRNWGSGIVSQDHSLQKISVDTEFEGAVMTAESQYSSALELTLISFYGLFEDVGGTQYTIPNLHRMLSDLTGLFEGKTHGNRNIILGGDLNASIQFDKQFNIDSHRIFFERLEAFGLRNCLHPFYEDFVRTYRDPRSDVDWQMDYLFVNDWLSNNLVECEVLENEKIKELSDHNPVVVTLDI